MFAKKNDFEQLALVVEKVLRRRPTAFENVSAVPERRPSSRWTTFPPYPTTNHPVYTEVEVLLELVKPPQLQSSLPKHLKQLCPLHLLSSHLSPLENLLLGWSAQSLRGFRYSKLKTQLRLKVWQVYPNPDSCHQFYKCANGTLTLETCGNGLLFNEVVARCFMDMTTYDIVHNLACF